MRIKTAILLCGVLGVSACGFGESRLNPLNWFGSSESVPVEASAEPASTNPLIPQRSGLFSRSRERQAVYPGTPVEEITGLVIERVPGGAIIRATGVASSIGVFDVRLTPENEEETPVDGVLTYRLEGITPPGAIQTGTTRQREVFAGRQLTDQQLQAVRSIRVEGRTNAQVTRRR